MTASVPKMKTSANELLDCDERSLSDSLDGRSPFPGDVFLAGAESSVMYAKSIVTDDVSGTNCRVETPDHDY